MSEEHAPSDCVSSIFYPEYEDKNFLRNSSTSLSDDTVTHLYICRRQGFEFQLKCLARIPVGEVERDYTALLLFKILTEYTK